MGDDFVVIYRGKAFPSLQPRPTLIVMPDQVGHLLNPPQRGFRNPF